MIFDKFIASAPVVAGGSGDARMAVNTLRDACLCRHEVCDLRRISSTRSGYSRTATEVTVLSGFTAGRFPRLKSRGPIEALRPDMDSINSEKFPRLKSRGPIEAVSIVNGLVQAYNFRG